MKDKIVRTLEEEGFGEERVGEESVYGREARLHLVEDDEMSPEEAAFMQGYDEAS